MIGVHDALVSVSLGDPFLNYPYVRNDRYEAQSFRHLFFGIWALKTQTLPE